MSYKILNLKSRGAGAHEAVTDAVHITRSNNAIPAFHLLNGGGRQLLEAQSATSFLSKIQQQHVVGGFLEFQLLW